MISKLQTQLSRQQPASLPSPPIHFLLIQLLFHHEPFVHSDFPLLILSKGYQFGSNFRIGSPKLKFIFSNFRFSNSKPMDSMFKGTILLHQWFQPHISLSLTIESGKVLWSRKQKCQRLSTRVCRNQTFAQFAGSEIHELC